MLIMLDSQGHAGGGIVNLGDLLSLLRTAYLNDRSDRTAGSSDYLWTDETLVTYINEAQNRFARKGLILRDGRTPEVTRVLLVEAQTTYDLHASILAVISAKREDQDVDIARAGHSILNAYRAPSENWIDPATLTGMAAGAPLAFSTDEDLGEDDNGARSVTTLRVYPAPSAAVAGKYLRLRVVRKPLEPLRLENLTQIPEIPEDHHIEMLDWAAHLALRIVDDDAGSPKRAEEFRASFEDHVAKARATAMRKLFAPMPWGLGSRGFSWGN